MHCWVDNIHHSFKVEIDKGCQKLITSQHPESCVFGDILELVSNPPDEDEWTPTKLNLVKKAWCVQHHKECKLPVGPAENDCALLGAPCILFSLYGKHEGFSNKILKRCHDVGARFQQRTLVSVHENVPNYEEVPGWSSGTFPSSRAATARVELRLNKLFSFASHGEEDTKEGALRECYRQFRDSREFQAFLQKFWSLDKRDQDAMARLRKVESGAPDLRYGKRAEPRSSALAWTVDSFLQIAYDRIAETLPDKVIRRGRATKPPVAVDLDDDDRDSGFEEVGLDIDPDEMAEWLNNNQSISTGLLPKEIKAFSSYTRDLREPFSIADAK
ncbi:unnamed protein product [Durusdinium trenchii]|uniref:Uncharacterized protein n=1 Tax=Durusdinium trenchii TaxID=1381693 RepID=A0ABP0L839_9DINO